MADNTQKNVISIPNIDNSEVRYESNGVWLIFRDGATGEKDVAVKIPAAGAEISIGTDVNARFPKAK